MRQLFWTSVLLIAIVIAGCARAPKPEPHYATYQSLSGKPTGTNSTVAGTKAAPIASAPVARLQPAASESASGEAKAPETNQIVTLATGLNGKVSTANANLKFVVLTFPIGQMASVDQRLNVYRGGMKVGELNVTGPQREDSIVADIVAGEAQAGDEVRDK